MENVLGVNLFIGPIAVDDRMSADSVRVSGMETLYESASRLLFMLGKVGEPRSQGFFKAGVRKLAKIEFVQLSEDLVTPVATRLKQAALAGAIELSSGPDQIQPVPPQVFIERGRLAVNEFGAQLDHLIRFSPGKSPNPSAYSVTGLKDQDSQSRIAEPLGRGQSGYACADDDDVGLFV